MIGFLLLTALPALAADPIYGVWRMRNDHGSQGVVSQVVTVEDSGQGTKFSYDIELSNDKHLQYEFVQDGWSAGAGRQPMGRRS